MLVASWGLSHPAAPGRAITTISRLGRSALCLRKDSLTRRLIRLRWTADLETLRDTARPRRAEGPGPGAAMTVNQGSAWRLPDLNTRVNSAGDSRRCAGEKPWEGADSAGAVVTAVPANPTSDGESGTPLGAPTGQHQPAALRGHAGPETVGPLPFQIARLIGAFHRTDSVRRVPQANPCEAGQKDGKSYARLMRVSTDPAHVTLAAPPVDNSGPAI